MADSNKSNYHHGDLRNSLIKAAISLIRIKGPNAFSLREVAKQAGVSHGAPYRHFKDRDDLLAAIATQGFHDLAQRVQTVRQAHPDDPLNELKHAGRAYLNQALENPEIIQLMFGGYIDQQRCENAALAEASAQAFNELLVTIQRCQEANLMRPATTQELAVTVWSLIHGAAMLIAGGNMQEEATGFSPAQLLDRMQSILFMGMRNEEMIFQEKE